MPIRDILRPLYPADWDNISQYVRFEREKGFCQHCGRKHGDRVARLPGKWFDSCTNQRRASDGSITSWPDIFEHNQIQYTVIVLATAHLDNNPSNNSPENLAALCQKCHLAHDRKYHLLQSYFTYRSRWAIGDFFLGDYKEIAFLAALHGAVSVHQCSELIPVAHNT